MTALTPLSQPPAALQPKPLDPVLEARRQAAAAAAAAEQARVVAEREDRLRERARKADAENQRRLALDAMEANSHAEARAAALERANQLLWRETEAVKAFHNALALSDVLAEREAQVQHKQALEAAKKRRDDAFAAREKAALALADEEEKAKQAARKAAAAEARSAQEEQLHEHMEQLRVQSEARTAEGHRLRAQGEQFAQEDLAAAAARRAAAVQAAAETASANMALKELKAKEKERDAEQDAKIAQQIADREAAVAARAKAEADAMSARNATRAARAEEAEARLAAIRAADAARVDREFDEARIAEDDREERAAAARRAAYASMERSRQRQIEFKAAKAAAEADALAHYTEHVKQLDAAWNAQLAAERAETKKQALALQAAHLKAIEDKAAKRAKQQERDRAEAEAALRAMMEDDQFVAAYKAQTADAWRAAGRDMGPTRQLAKKKSTDLQPTK